jgi:hemolysin activation/secretion protein
VSAVVLLGSAAIAVMADSSAVAQQSAPARDVAEAKGVTKTVTPAPVKMDISEYRVEGAHLLPRDVVEQTVYPYLGPGHTTEDVEKARAALEKAYNAAGYQTVGVEIPQQQVRNGIVTLRVTEGSVGKLRVHGSRYYSLQEIKAEAPSLAEGAVPNFHDVQRDIVALNQQPDRRVTPALRAGETPGTVDVDLNVEDTLPLHGSIEYNNRNSINTTQSRLTASLHYDNLWQLGHSLSFTYQVAPQRPSDAEVYSLSYLARIPQISWLSFLVYGVKQDSDVSTIGAIDVAGRGEIAGARAILTLPYSEGFFHTLSMGFDYKHFDQGVTLSGQTVQAPITYYPLTATYSATWMQDTASTQFDTTLTMHLRGMGSDPAAFDTKRFKSSGDFFYLRSDVSRTQELPFGFQGFGKLQGQLASDPLVSAEEIAGGGLDTVRGYLESEVLGDNGIMGTLELRSPSLPTFFGKDAGKSFINDWRVYLFADGGTVSINAPLPDQQSIFNLASWGGGSRVKLLDHLNASVDIGIPLISQAASNAHDPRVLFRVWTEF